MLWMRERGTLAQEGKIERVTADPDDGYLVVLSKASGADLIVSEEHHLVELEGEDLRRVV